MRLYALRHGETSWNVQRRFQGQSDIPLNDKGILLAELTGEGLANVPFDLAFTSPLCRARQTAELVLAGRDVPLYVEPRLIEMAFGVYEGVTANSGPGGTLNQNLVDFICHAERYQAPEGGETFQELSKRMAETPEDRHLRSQLLRAYQADIKTVDAFCTALLRENTHLLAQERERYTLTPDFRVLDENDAKLLRQRVLTRVLERFYEELDEGGALLADTLGAGRDDSALEDLVLETYEKLQSHADPEHWLAENRTIWENRSGDFDETPYAAELLAVIRRKGFHHMEALRRAGQSTVGGDLYKGYGEKFLRASHSFAPLAAAQNWEAARISLDGLEFPRLTTPKGMAEDPEVVRLKGLWENAKTAAKKLAPMLAVSDTEAMEDLQTMAPAMTALLKLTADFSDAYRTEKLRMNSAVSLICSTVQQ